MKFNKKDVIIIITEIPKEHNDLRNIVTDDRSGST